MRGLVGLEKAEVKDQALVDSYDPRTDTFGGQGDVVSNREVHIHDYAMVHGLAIGDKCHAEFAGDADRRSGMPTGQSRTPCASVCPRTSRSWAP